MPTAPSIHESVPREHGGTNARRGFVYQDHVAVAFYLEMLTDEQLAAVWCEAEDDITLIWDRDVGESVEFVQVKQNELEQLWTAALICSRDGAATTETFGETRPNSLMEKSLSHDRFREPCTFRVVTSWQLHPDLAVLKYPLAHAHRANGSSIIDGVITKIATVANRSGRFVSLNERDVTFWVRHVLWDVRESVTALSNANLHALEEFVATRNGFLAIDQRKDLYLKLLVRAKEAAAAPWDPEPAQKKQARIALLDYMKGEIRKAERPSLGTEAEPLRHKMQNAGLSATAIESAWELRQRYRADKLAGKYLSVEDRDVVEAEVQARLHELLTALYANEIDDSAEQFHHRCIRALRELRDELPSKPPISMMQGAMYDITARCRHQFTRLTPADLPPFASRESEGAA